ncbi:MAG: transporter substrate-binding domain-containing protein [Campylobacteraceae bacterium]|nr:transporter substrate-binding domain-containing protein [Campylobacteraceae bacterium]
MRKFSRKFSVFLVGAAVFINLAYADNSTERIKNRGVLIAGINTDVEKFGYKNPQTNIIDGFEIDMVRAIAKKILGNESKIELVPITPRSREYLLYSGKLDIVAATFTITDERKKYYNFSSPYYADGLALMVRKGSNIKSLKDLNGKSIGTAYSATSRGVLRDIAAKSGMKFKFFAFSSYSEINSALAFESVDCFAADRSILAQYANNNTVILDDMLSVENYGIASLKSDTELGKIVNEVVNGLKSSGELDKMAQKWGLKN